MRFITPRLDGPVARIAEHQPEYEPVDVIKAMHPDYPDGRGGQLNSVIMCVELSAEERQRIISKGEDIYIALLTYGAPQQPVLVTVGPEEMGRIYELPVKKVSRISEEVKPLILDKYPEPCGDADATGAPGLDEGAEDL